ncbi:hypothetical protein GGR33_003181 [Methylobacterium brachythecii]|uniref:Uncharacterized protein n=1 Tax=Methylobacterium brachythecii TaxID=1176177 RepID=A0A7W6AHY4_9HYPH|nr:hypothetical protein [Methylobacterium brachythecii]MBB3903672.1 hypothetical protein [Methylobacterium brachythecii]GLS44242.1 hypothetical protein GCM10007884_22300 [Methylobacterium brachythecii]
MAIKVTFVVQSFVIKQKRLVLGGPEVARTESGALKKAEAMASRVPGTAAIRVMANDETGEHLAKVTYRAGACANSRPRSKTRLARSSFTARCRYAESVRVERTKSTVQRVLAGLGNSGSLIGLGRTGLG